ncbi:hypothetical protein CWI75_10680 [Kineobactrum sediminis]|uniref:Uncharacterized protein n=1 Tax=Kineobactrum sediminis TaxID=1905677 RepID=A0A2N5Y1H6_9GAMM|nr:hypothetical protein [Kineobactrum sediminis]PLW82235.1 hypothetical protein CWI75_10680 [Kineobactrum sediminis]
MEAVIETNNVPRPGSVCRFTADNFIPSGVTLRVAGTNDTGPDFDKSYTTDEAMTIQKAVSKLCNAITTRSVSPPEGPPDLNLTAWTTQDHEGARLTLRPCDGFGAVQIASVSINE